MSYLGFLLGKSKKSVLGNDKEQPTESIIYDMPLPDTLEELDVLQLKIANKMSERNAIGNQLTQKMIMCSQKGETDNFILHREQKESISQEIRFLSGRLMEITKKREDIIERAKNK